MKTLQVVGPYFTNFSFARVNRGLAIGLSKIQDEYKINLYCSKETIDYLPNEEEVSKRNDIKNLVKFDREESDVVIYNNFPKNITSPHKFAELPGRTKIMYVAWEESVYPEAWVKEANENLHGIMTASNFTKRILERAGIQIPIVVVPNALDDSLLNIKTEDYPLNTNKNFKFLHISTAKKRKGVDVLLKAYFEEFTKDDDVTLIIKAFPGPDNEVDKLLKELKTENSPEVIYINNPDLTEQELANLHATATCEVYPSRAEGFGLPILEAMYLGTPVIATNYSAYLDFCDEDSAYLVDYKLEYAKDSELVNIGAKWAEPDKDDLRKKMREVFETAFAGSDKDIFHEKIALAQERASKYTWENSAKKAFEFVREVEKFTNLKNKKIAVVTPINDETGIADYSEDLYKSIKSSFKEFYFVANSDIADRSADDGVDVKRLWKSGEETFKDFLKFVNEKSIDIVHIQYHSGNFFSPESLGRLIENLKNDKREAVVTLHAVRNVNFDFIRECPNLKLADKVLIHNTDDFEYAKGTLKNAVLYKHFNIEFEKRSKIRIRKELGIEGKNPIIATHGLLNTNKGIPEVIKAVALLKESYSNVLLLCLNAVSNNNIAASSLLENCKTLIKHYKLESNVRFFTDFLKDEVIEVFLQASDVVVFNYSDVGESASAAVRKGLASLNPVIITNIKQFSEFKDECFRIKDNSPEEVSDAILQIVRDSALNTKLVESEKRYVDENNVEKKAMDLLKLYS